MQNLSNHSHQPEQDNFQKQANTENNCLEIEEHDKQQCSQQTLKKQNLMSGTAHNQNIQNVNQQPEESAIKKSLDQQSIQESAKDQIQSYKVQNQQSQDQYFSKEHSSHIQKAVHKQNDENKVEVYQIAENQQNIYKQNSVQMLNQIQLHQVKDQVRNPKTHLVKNKKLNKIVLTQSQQPNSQTLQAQLNKNQIQSQIQHLDHQNSFKALNIQQFQYQNIDKQQNLRNQSQQEENLQNVYNAQAEQNIQINQLQENQNIVNSNILKHQAEKQQINNGQIEQTQLIASQKTIQFEEYKPEPQTRKNQEQIHNQKDDIVAQPAQQVKQNNMHQVEDDFKLKEGDFKQKEYFIKQQQDKNVKLEDQDAKLEEQNVKLASQDAKQTEKTEKTEKTGKIQEQNKKQLSNSNLNIEQQQMNKDSQKVSFKQDQKQSQIQIKDQQKKFIQKELLPQQNHHQKYLAVYAQNIEQQQLTLSPHINQKKQQNDSIKNNNQQEILEENKVQINPTHNNIQEDKKAYSQNLNQQSLQRQGNDKSESYQSITNENNKKVSVLNQTSRRKLNIVHDKSVHQLVIDLHKSESNRQQIPKHRPHHFPKSNKEAPNLNRLVHNITLQSNIMNISVGQIFQSNKKKSDDMQSILKDQIQTLKKQIAFYEKQRNQSEQQESRIYSHESRSSNKGSNYYQKKESFRHKQYGKIVKKSQMQSRQLGFQQNQNSMVVVNGKIDEIDPEYFSSKLTNGQLNQNYEMKSSRFRIKKQGSDIRNSVDKKPVGQIVDFKYNQSKSQITIGQFQLTKQKIDEGQDDADSVLQNKFFNHKNQNHEAKDTKLKNVENYERILKEESFHNISVTNLVDLININLSINITESLKSQASQQDLVQLAKNVFYKFGIDIEEPDYLLNIKKYKNCVSFNLNPDDNVIWHYDGKFFFGGWKTQSGSNQTSKNGWGYQISPQKYQYKGQYQNSKRKGFGIIKIYKNKEEEISQNKSKKGEVYYVGSWENGNRNGSGVQIQINQNFIIHYKGMWEDNKKSGHGLLTIIQKNQNNQYDVLQTYEGDFMNGHKEGLGKETYSNGDSYAGNYHHNKFHGEGKYVWTNGSNYSGQFQFGMRSGHGIWKSSLQHEDFQCYEGAYVSDKKNGYGVYKWKNGTIYEGQFKDDLKHGEGHLIYDGSRQVKHTWQNGQIVQKNSNFKLGKKSQKQLSQSRNESFDNKNSCSNKSNGSKRPLTSNKNARQIKAKISDSFPIRNKLVDLESFDNGNANQTGQIVHQINFRHKSIKQKQIVLTKKSQLQQNPQKIRINKQFNRNLHPHPSYKEESNIKAK